MDRRKFLTRSANTLGALGIAAAKLPAGAEAPKASTTSRRPNILLIMSDQHKRTCMGVAGDAVARTPHLDALARESVRFTNAYCASPICAVSRACMLTGQWAHNIEARGNQKPFAFRHKTIAHDLNHAGYMTGLIGKMHLVDGQTHGFDYELEFNDWFQQLGPKTKLYAEEVGHVDSGAGLPQIESLWPDDPWKGHREEDDRQGAVAVGRPSKMEEKDHFESFVARESVRFLENYGQGNEPFFLISSFLKPHEPFMPAKRFAEMFPADAMQLPLSWHKADLATLPVSVRESMDEREFTPELKDPAQAKIRLASYYANLAQMDDCAGQILAALKRLKLDENTIVIYTSDHGDMLGDLGLWGKTQFYEGSCGVPLMVRMPGVKAGICEKPVSLISFAATFAEFAGVESPRLTDGKSFASLVASPGLGSHDEPVFAEFALGTKKAKYFMRKGTWKYAYWTHDLPELYDLASDPQELRNLAAAPEHQQKVAEMKRELFAWHTPAEA